MLRVGTQDRDASRPAVVFFEKSRMFLTLKTLSTLKECFSDAFGVKSISANSALSASSALKKILTPKGAAYAAPFAFIRVNPR
jgi:hypothetical protein